MVRSKARSPPGAWLLIVTRSGAIARAAFSWGANADGQLGQGHFETRSTPHLMKTALGEELPDAVLHVACGGRHTVVLTEGGQDWSCGSNDCGQLGRRLDGDGMSANATLCVVSGFGPVPLILVACGGAHSAALNLDGRCFTCVTQHRKLAAQSCAAPLRFPSHPAP